MTRKPERRALGRGLSALLGDDAPTAKPPSSQGETAQKAETRVPIDLISANPEQPRQTFRDSDLDDLARSLAQHGVIQPVVLRPDPKNPKAYQIVAGERRWRAAQRAGLHDLPAVVRDLNDRELLEIAIIENVQRVDLDPVEEARGYVQLVETFEYTQEDLAKIIGKSRSHLANTMRLLALPDQVLNLLRNGKLSAGHARALINAADPVGLAEQVVIKGLTVRQTEDLARKLPESKRQSSPKPTSQKDADTRAIEGDLSAAIGMKVSIEHVGADGSGELRIQYRDLDQLDQLCRKLGE